MDRLRDLEVSSIFRWAIVCQEVRSKEKKASWEGEGGVMSGNGGRAATSGVEVATVATAMMGSSSEVAGEGMVATGDVGEGPEVRGDTGGGTTVTGEDESKTGGGSGTVDGCADATGSRDRVTGSGGGAMGTPPTPTVKELLAAAEKASDERGGEEMTTSQVTATPVLRTTEVEPRGGDSGIGASHPVPFVEGDFLDSVGSRDILDALGLDAGIAAVLRGARTLEDQTSTLLLGALLSSAGVTASGMGSPEIAEMRVEELEQEAVVEERVTVVGEVKAYLEGEHPGFAPATYAPRSHFFEPVGMISYVPARADYPEDLLL
ncbi:hypothetical protein RHMOL_Rhmol02G0165800 [Rhododendron molle]|uniref:Uncharacterized protein n=1 Tax=Rhododendron molle TaxID=49168 RepID=A0ACC0PQZ7_RHOML|nr:hypothetical protein RHMOL_Rhmol02G0165800 [Rhododendron molle]